jgi:hypothetical protein
MRSILLIVGTVGVLAIVFGLYMAAQSHQAAVPQLAAQAKPPTDIPVGPLPSQQQLHQGEDAFFQVFDKHTGELTSQYRAHRYDPQPDGTVELTLPEADFFLNDGQVMKVSGQHGRVVMPPGAQESKSVGAGQTPSRGTLFNVTLKMYRTRRSASPYEICTVDNLEFDNDSFRIAAGPIVDATGNVTVPADQVPVKIRGSDYDFDGNGLLIKWDERDRHLLLLRIDHGRRLIIKHPNSGNVQAPGMGVVQRPISPRLRGDELASADPSAAGMILADATNGMTDAAPAPKTEGAATAPATTEPVIHELPYEATFNRDVVITQAGQTLATADRMDVDFINKSGPTSTPGGAQAAGSQARARTAASTGEQSAEEASIHHRSDHDAAAENPAVTRSGSAATQPSTQPAAPIIINWTGPLTVAPFVAGDLTPGDSVVQMSSERSAVVLDREGSHARCASFRYHTIDDSLSMTSSAACPLVQVDGSDGSHITTPQLQYDGATQIAELEGTGLAILPVQGKQNAPASAQSPTTSPTTRPAQLVASWSHVCTLAFSSSSTPTTHPTAGSAGGKAMVIRRATLDGDVHIDHPQIALQAGLLDLTFDPPAAGPTTQPGGTAAADQSSAGKPRPTSQPVLRSLEATDNVDCRLKDTSGAADGTPGAAKDESIRAHHLFVRTVPGPDGNASPREILADGNVCASDPDQQLSAQQLKAELEPTTQPATQPSGAASAVTNATQNVQLKSMVAQNDVQFRAKDGTGADAQKLTIDVTPQGRQVLLSGDSITPMADVRDKNSTVWGRTIWFDEASQFTRINGAGHAHLIQQASQQGGGPTTRPTDLSWSNGMYVDGKANRGLVDGNVIVQSIDSDGSHDGAHGDRMTLLLADAPPATQPTTRPAPSVAAKSRQGARTGGLAGMTGSNTSFMKDKVLREMHLIGEPVEARSILADAETGQVLRRMHLFAPELIYEPQTRSMIVPDPGRLLVQDNRPQPKTPGQPDTGSPSAPGGGRGATAFRWDNRLTYDDSIGRVTMTGNVLVVHEAPNSDRYELHAQTVAADLDRSKPATQPATQSSKHDRDAAGAHLRRLSAEGDVRMISGHMSFDAQSFEYDPTTGIMIATAPDRRPAHLLDESGVSTGTFNYLQYNSKTRQVESLIGFHADMRSK